MEIWNAILHNSTPIRDIGTLVFAAVGAFFAYLAWWQRRLEIKEKFFERRYSLYSELGLCVSTGQFAGNMEWRRNIYDLTVRANFLFGTEAGTIANEIQSCLEKLLEADSRAHNDARLQDITNARGQLNDAWGKFSLVAKRHLAISE